MKKNLKLRTLMYPAPAVVASAYDKEGNVDACTLAFATMCSHKPPCVLIAINSTLKRKTLKSILETNAFCIGFPSIENLSEIDYLGIETGYNVNKIEKIDFTSTPALKIYAPIINEFKLSMECEVKHIVDVGSHTQIFGEVVNIQAEDEIINEKGKIDFKKLNPIIYDDVGYDYYKVGEKIASAFNIGKKFKD